MKLNIIAVGKRMPAWITTGFTEYAKRLSHPFNLTLVELNTEKRQKNNDTVKCLQKEAEQIQQKLSPGSVTIALDERGQMWSTRQLADKLSTWHDDDRTVNFIIGGPDGLDPKIKQLADSEWSLGKLVLPHPLVRIILIEQLYRAVSILQNHPYHRD